jgi:hypothetical protein
MHIAPPTGQDYGFFNNYIYKIKDKDLLTAFEDNWQELKDFFTGLTPEQLDYSYAPGKWTIKEVLQHLVDGERTFAYRILRVSRNDQVPVPPYSPDGFITNSWVKDRSVANIMKELELLRTTNIICFSEMPAEVLERTGPGRDAIVSVRALGFAMVGHAAHHLQVLREKYGVGVV